MTILTVVDCCHLIREPKLSPGTNVCLIGVMYFFLITPIVSLAVFAQLIAVGLAYYANRYPQSWLDELEANQSAYDCTFSTLYIDFDKLRNNENFEDFKSITTATIVLCSFNTFLLLLFLISFLFWILRWYKNNQVYIAKEQIRSI